MAFSLSPGVSVSEIDLTAIIPVVSTTTGGLVGTFKWGPLNEVTLVDSEGTLVTGFGKPDANTFISFFTAANFLAYGDQLQLVRVANETTAKNATADGNGLLIKNDTHYTNSFSSGQATSGLWAGKFAGDMGNSLKVSMCPSADAYSVTLTGTSSSSGTTVTGTTSAFDTELVVGSYITNAAGTETKKVTAIASATSLTIESAFTVSLSSETITGKWEYADTVGVQAPGTSSYVSDRSGSGDEMHLVVVDEDGVLTGTPGTLLEKFLFISKASDAKKDDGTSNYYKNVVNNESLYIRWLDHLPAGTNWGNASAGTTFTAVAIPDTVSLAGGVDGNSTVANSYKELGYDLFLNTDTVDVSLLMGGDADGTLAEYIIQNIAEVRKDCIALISPESADVVNNVGSEVTASVAFRNSLTSSSYAVIDNNWKKQYDKYNDVYRWVPCNGDIAGLHVYTDTIRDPWYSPAGLNRGQIKNVVKLAYNPSKAERDTLYLNSLNPIVSFPGLGTVLYGDKTLLKKPSAFDRINVRRLFIVLEKAIATAAKFMLFEFNDEFTRAQFRNMVEPFLRDVKGRRGIYDFRVVSDETNNTQEVIDRNEFRGDIYIKPARSINFINLNFVAVRTGVKFDEIVGKI